MFRLYALMAVLALAAPVAQREETPTMEADGSIPVAPTDASGRSIVRLDELSNFPEDFDGKELTIRGLWLDGDLDRLETGDFAIDAKDALTGKYIFSGPGRASLSFFISGAMARKMQPYLDGGKTSAADVTFTMRRVRISRYAPQWAGLITSVDFLARDGSIFAHVEAEAPSFAR